jgi:hypothetical protein
MTFLCKMIESITLTTSLTYIGDERDAWTNEEMPYGLSSDKLLRTNSIWTHGTWTLTNLKKKD